MKHDDDALLLNAFLREEAGAEEQFVARFLPVIRTGVEAAHRRYSAMPHVDVIQDLVQDTFLHLWEDNQRRLRAFDAQKASLPTYLSVIAYRHVVAFLRKRAKEKGIGKLIENLPDTSDVQFQANPSELLKAAATLPSRERAVFLLRFEQGLSYRQIAELTGMTTGAVGAFIARARSRLEKRDF